MLLERGVNSVNTVVDVKYFDDITVAFMNALELGYFDMVDLLLKKSQINPAILNNGPIIYLVANEYTDAIKKLLEDPRVDPSDQDNEALMYASDYGYLDIMDILLQDPRVDPSARGNHALDLAIGEDHLDIVKRLLQDPRFDPSTGIDDLHLALIEISQNEETHLIAREIINLLLNNKKFSFYSQQNVRDAIEYAEDVGSMDIAQDLRDHAESKGMYI